MSEENATINPKDLTFVINGEQINTILSVLGKLPYETVYLAIDVMRVLQRVDLKQQETQLNTSLEE